VLVEANLDFAEDETGYVLQPLLGAEIAAVDAALQKLLDAAKNGRALQEGCRVVIMGKPNAGKSSLLNALSQTDSAIVSDLPGTTRDPVATTVILDGMPVHVTDTAGLREATDAIEAEGIRRAYATAKQADIVLLVTDGEAGIDPDELATLRTHSSTATCIIVVNKIDLFDMSPRIESLDPEQRVYLSAKSGAGVDLLQALIERHCGQVDGGNSFSARQRHLDCLRLAREALQPLLHSNHGINLPDDLVAECLRDAQAALGEITGTVTTEALLGEIFQTFCIGK
jgi:tRNA modification GTPase